jgi:hypothetical protein
LKRRLLDVFEENDVVVVGDSYSLDTLVAARSNEFLGVLPPFIIGNSACPIPVAIAGGVYLNITLMKMSATVHKSPPSSEVDWN